MDLRAQLEKWFSFNYRMAQPYSPATPEDLRWAAGRLCSLVPPRVRGPYTDKKLALALITLAERMEAEEHE